MPAAAHLAGRLALAAATIGAGAIAPDRAAAQQQRNACVLALEGFEASTNPGAPGCIYSRSVGPEADNIVMGVFLYTYDTEDEARRNFATALGTHFSDGRNRMRPVEGLGDEGAEIIWHDTTTDVTGIYRGAVRRACRLALVNYSSGGRVQGTVQLDGKVGADLAREVDRQLRAIPCPGGAAPSESIGVRLSCQRSHADTGRATCIAVPQGAEPGSTLRYGWRVDGRRVEGGDALELTGLGPGSHEIEVVLTDDARNLTSEPQRVRLEVAAPTDTPGIAQPLPAGLDPDRENEWLTPAAVAGLGLLALGVTGAVLRNRRSRPLGAPLVGPEAPAAPRPGWAPRPTTLPERPVARPRQTEAAADALETLRDLDDLATARTPPPLVSLDDTPRDIWLEADRLAIQLKGDARAEASVTITARKLVNGVATPATGEVALSWTSGDPQCVSVVLDGVGRLRLKALYVGTSPLTAQVAVAGTHTSGAPVRGVPLTVTVDPVRATVRVVARKEGFADTEMVEVLPGMTRAVTGRLATYVVEPWSELDSRPEPLVFPIEEARCEVSVRIEEGTWSRAVTVRTDAKGRFRAPLPPWPGEPGAVTDVHELAASGRVTLARDVEAEWRRYFEELPRIPDAGAFALVQVRCDTYPRAWVKRLAEAPERDVPYARAALNLLRVAIVFAAKGRRDFMDQRRDLAVRIGDDLLGSLVDVFTDVVEVASALYNWGVRGLPFEVVLKRKGAAPIVWRLPTLRQILLAVAAFKAGWLLLRLAEPFLGLLTSAQEKVNTAVRDLIEQVPALLNQLVAGRAGPLPLKRILKQPPPLGPMPDPEGDVVERLLATAQHLSRLAAESVEVVLRSLTACLTVLLHVALLFIASVLKKVVPDGFIKGVSGAAGEWIEEHYIGPAVSSLYEAGAEAADALAGWMGSARRPEGLGIAGLFIDAIAERDAYDRRLAAALDAACDRCERCDVSHDWLSALRPVREAEVRMMAEWQSSAEWERVADLTIAVIKSVVKVVQVTMFIIGSVGSLAASFWKQVASSDEAPEPGDMAGAVETFVDLGVLCERLVVVAVHASRLAGLSAWSAARIHGLFAKGRPV